MPMVAKLVCKEATLLEGWLWLPDHKCRCCQKNNFIFYCNSTYFCFEHPSSYAGGNREQGSPLFTFGEVGKGWGGSSV